MIFKTKRLEAHILNKENEHFLIDLYQCEHNKKFLQGLNAMRDIELTYDCYRARGIGAYLIFCRESGSFIGFGGVQNQEPLANGNFAFDDEIEFLIMIDARHGGKGYAKEFSAEFLNFFFAKFPNYEVPARVSKNNIACIKLLEKLGFCEIGEVAYCQEDNRFLFLKAAKKIS